jgi:hypothetical protein
MTSTKKSPADWIPVCPSRPEDARSYDIRLEDGTVVTGVEYWDHGAGFDPLPPGERSAFGDAAVRYPLRVVRAFRPHRP